MEREEAIEIARKLYNDSLFMKKDKEAMVTLIPELKESYDEKIRKEMIFYFQEEIPQCSIQEHADKMKKFIAWLEKQGEQNPVVDDKDAEKASEGYRNFRMSCGIKDPVMLNEIEEAYYEGAIRKQKPAETQIENSPAWSEEDREMRMKVLKYLSTRCNVFEYEDVECWLKSLKDRVGCEVNCTTTKEWSEYDEESLLELSQCCDLNKTQVQWLLSLKDRVLSQPKQEWSEEDEENFKGVMDALNFCNHEGINPYDIDPLYLVSWFKSLKDRYTWKPSDEQMVALDNFIYTKYPNIEKYETAVKSLYQDLKKLREE